VTAGRRIGAAAALCGLGGVALALAVTTAGCAATGRWLDARRARRPPYRTVTPAVASEIVRDTPEIFVLDLRPPDDFQGPYGHLLGAVNIPLSRLPYRLLELKVYRLDSFLVYCDADDCGRAGMSLLAGSGFHEAILIGGGIEGWLRGGFPTYVRTDTRRPPNAKLRSMPHAEMVPERMKPKYEAPVVPPPLAPLSPASPPSQASPPAPPPPAAPPSPAAAPSTPAPGAPPGRSIR
jgi:rhodanese-related sulfurtransferase